MTAEVCGHNYTTDEAGKIAQEPDVLKWAEWFETADRTVAKTEIGAIQVSTVFLAIDHNFGGEGRPILFGTMVFGGGDELDKRGERYCTREEAIAGHGRWVAKVVQAFQPADAEGGP